MTDSVDYLIIGGGLAAKEAVRNLRKQDPNGTLLMVSEETHLPYDRPPLTKAYMLGKKLRDELFFENEAYYADNRIDVALGNSVTALQPSEHTATLADGRTVRYGKALLATGGRAVRLPIPGNDLQGVHYLRTLDDCDAIRKDAGLGKRAVIIGAGFIGLELAASLTAHGCHVHVLEMAAHIWPRFADDILAAYFQRYCEERGVTFHCNERVSELLGEHGRVTAVRTAAGTVLDADFVCIGVGIRPNVELAKEAGLAVDNGIVVDQYLRTSDPDIHAAGDVINYPDVYSGRRRRVEHWTHANMGGRVAALNMAGKPTPYEALSFVWSDIFDLELKFLGDEHEHERTIMRGAIDSHSFAILYITQGHIIACFVVNGDPREFSTMRRLIQSKVNVIGREDVLTDPAGDLKSLL